MKEKGGHKTAKSFKASAPVEARNAEASSNGGAVKLSKQERRNLNKQKKAVTVPVVSNIVPTTHTESVYKRETVYPPSMSDCGGPWDRFVTPEDPELPNILATSYDGCVVSTADKFKPSFHNDFQAAMEGLDREGYYQFDLTQPAGLGTKVAKTFVTRCLVGDAGTTYKYLGLRMFSIPWNNDTDDTLTSPSAVQVGRLNNVMVKHTEELLRRSGRGKVGSCQYNLTLINRCFPQDRLALKNEPGFERDKCSVSWHADSTLEHFSTIGVYHCTSATPVVAPAGAPAASSQPAPVQGAEQGDRPGEQQEDLSWRIALRVWYDAEGPNATRALSSRAGEMAGARIAPAVAIPLPSRAAYFLLDDFNHHHQHAVLAGNTYRYASTHRVCKTEGHTYQSVRAKCARLLQQVPAGSKLQFLGRNIRAEQMMQSELEFEWLRQFYVQGHRHRELHAWWAAPMQELLRLWGELQGRLVATLEVLRAASVFDYRSEFATTGPHNEGEDRGEVSEEAAAQRRERKRWLKTLQRIECVDASCYDAVMDALKERHEKRAGWAAREKDPLFATVPVGYAPLHCPIVETLVHSAASAAAPPPGPAGAAGGSGEATEALPRVTSLLNLAQCVGQWKKTFEKNVVNKASVAKPAPQQQSDGVARPHKKAKKAH